MNGIVVTQSLDLAALDAMVATTIIDFLRLYQNDHVPTVEDTPGSFVEATYDGYGAEEITWSGSFVNDLGKGQKNGGSITFLCTGSGTPNTIYGFFLTDTPNSLVGMACRFETPIEVTAAGIVVTIQPVVTAVSEVT